MKKNSIFEDKRVVVIAALVVAALSWIIIAGFINPGQQRPINYVLIDYDRTAQEYLDKNLQIVGEISEVYADVQVQGDGAVIGPLNERSVAVYVDYGGINGPGTYEVPLRTERVTAGSYNIVALSVRGSGYSLDNPKETVTLTFEEVEEKFFTVNVRAEGITAESGYFRDTPRIDGEVRIYGPKTRVEQIAQVVAELPNQEVLRTSKKYSGIELTLLNENGEEIEKEGTGLTIDPLTVDVEVPILEIRTIGLTATFVGMPQYFDSEWFESRLQLSTEEMQVVGATAAFEHVDDPTSIATFDVTELEANWESEPVNINIEQRYEGLRNYDNLRQVIVSFDTTDLVERTYEVPGRNITVTNAPRNAEVSPVSDSLSVRLLGPEEQLEGLLPENISVQLDASDITVSRSGQHHVPARVLIPRADRVLAIGEYSMVCDVVVS